MPIIKKLSLRLKSGLLSELQSDTILGHFCWRLKDKFGEDKLKEFISPYFNNNPVFTISNSFFEKDFIETKTKKVLRTEIFFPKPMLHIKSGETGKTKKDKMIGFLINKEMKSKNYLTLSQFNLVLNGKIDELYNKLLADDIEYPKFQSNLRVSVEIDRQSFSSKEGQLFSYNPKHLDENTRIIFFVKIFNEKAFTDFDCENVLKDVFEVGFGKKKSSGYGQFEVISFNDFTAFEEPEEANGFITLSNYLPSSEDGITDDSKYDFLVKYGKLGEELSLSEKPFKKPIIMFTPGSCFISNKKKDHYGRTTRISEISEFKPEAIQFGTPFTLKFKI